MGPEETLLVVFAPLAVYLFPLWVDSTLKGDIWMDGEAALILFYVISLLLVYLV